MKSGESVQITFCGTTTPAVLLMVSPCEGSLLIGFDGVLRDHTGGMFLGMMPVLKDDDGVYHDLVGGEVITIEPLLAH